jgi:UDP-N-acetylmuramate dehydrogenase
LNIQKNISLKNYNTFGIDVIAKRFISVTSVYELQQLLKIERDIFLISGGSNMLLTKDINKLVVHIDIAGISIDRENENDVYLTVNAGENWHNFVLWCVTNNYGGIENLSLIPGNVGTCPIQNIGAYGVEVKDTITKVEAVEIETGKLVQFSNEDCNFGYRNSIFKNDAKDKFIITAVSFKLTKKKVII